jgi:hypothetical protein
MTSKVTLVVQNKIVCWIWGSHSGDYEQCGLLSHNALYFRESLTFQRNTSPPSSWLRVSQTRTHEKQMAAEQSEDHTLQDHFELSVFFTAHAFPLLY